MKNLLFILVTMLFFTISFKTSAKDAGYPNNGKFLMTFYGRAIEVAPGVNKYLAVYQVNNLSNRKDKKPVTIQDYDNFLEELLAEAGTMEFIRLAIGQGFEFPGLTICFDENSKVDSYGHKKFPIIGRSNENEGFFKENILGEGMYVIVVYDIPATQESNINIVER